MKNIYDDRHSAPFQDDFSLDGNPSSPSSDFISKTRRPYRTAEEKKEKRQHRLEQSAARRQAKNVAQTAPEPAQSNAPAADNEPTRYYVQYQNGSIPSLVSSKGPAAQNSSKQPTSHYTQGMKIVYQSEDFDRAAPAQTSSTSSLPVLTPNGIKPVSADASNSFFSQPSAETAGTSQHAPSPFGSTTRGKGDIPVLSPRGNTGPAFFSKNGVPVLETELPLRKIKEEPLIMPKYTAGRSYEEELKKSGRDIPKKERQFFVDDVTPKRKTVSYIPESRIENIPLEEAKKKAPVSTISPDVFDDDETDRPQEGTEHAPIRKKYSFTMDKTRLTILSISVFVALISALYLGYQWKLSRDNAQLQAEMSSYEQNANSGTYVSKKKKKDDSEPTTVPLTDEELLAKLKAENPGIYYPEALLPRYAQLYTDNQDLAGYLTISGLGISFPIVKSGSDDKYEYLYKNFYGEKTKYGCPFLRYDNSIYPLDRNTVIYGHSMRDGSIFAPILDYSDIATYRSNPVITFNTIYETHKWKIFAVYLTNVDAKDDNGYVFPFYCRNMSSDDAFMRYIEAIRIRSLYSTSVDVLPSDKILSVSTCAYDFDNARMVVCARMLRPGEDEGVDTASASVNNTPRYPQAYYKKNGSKNPYDTTYNWYDN